MKDKILPDDNIPQTLEELTKEVNQIIIALEGEKNLQDSMSNYQKLIKLNNLIEKKFQKSSKLINVISKEKINKIVSKKNEK